jgi:hypothetical protein
MNNVSYENIEQESGGNLSSTFSQLNIKNLLIAYIILIVGNLASVFIHCIELIKRAIVK